MKATRYFAIVATGFPGHPFPKFWDSFATLQRARAAAKQALQDGWRECEILRDKPRELGSIWIQRETVEILRVFK